MAQSLASAVGVKIGSYPIESLAFNEAAGVSADANKIQRDLASAISKIGRSGMSEDDKEAAREEKRARAVEKITRRTLDLNEKREKAGL